ncbi:hypothetical protein CICLE_v10006288mg [Citrus x clementina]|uniref:Uncharacterized protein n=1 Tax=Citrus clementina TaxID=85681 RepID=V4SC33_CITCL|nr:hypothetical protein CICLE_v10006288mg [Citrus x clementina]
MNEVEGSKIGERENLYFEFFLLALGTLDEIGDHTEASTAVLDDRDGGPPPSQGFLRWILVLHIEVFPVQKFVHFPSVIVSDEYMSVETEFLLLEFQSKLYTKK